VDRGALLLPEVHVVLRRLEHLVRFGVRVRVRVRVRVGQGLGLG